MRLPRRRDPINTELSVLLRDARPARGEIDRARARSAREVLMRMYRDAQKCGSMVRLDMRVRNLCADLIASNGGSLPKPKGGAPARRRQRRLLLAVKVREALEVRGKKRVTEAVLRDVAEQMGVGYDYLKRIHYTRDPEWNLAVKAELAHRKLKAWEATLPYSPALWFWQQYFLPLLDL
jgi:hypothetical protein